MVVEDNLNLYAAAGGALSAIDEATSIRVQPGLELQVFPFGLENLALNAGFGLNLALGSAGGIETDGALLTGAHYWF